MVLGRRSQVLEHRACRVSMFGIALVVLVGYLVFGHLDLQRK